MGKEYLENLHSIKNTGKDFTMKQMFDISEKLILEQSDETCGVNTIDWVDSAWSHLSLIGDEEVASLSRAKVYVFSDSVFSHGGIFSQDSPHCSSATKSKSPVKNERRTRRSHRTDHLHVDLQRHLMGI